MPILITSPELREFYPETLVTTYRYINSIGSNPVFRELHDTLFSTNLFQLHGSTPYPIQVPVIEKSAYQSRPRHEKEFVEALKRPAEDTFLILSGPEGSGKSSMIHYCLGHLLSGKPPQETVDPFKLYVDCKSWLAATDKLSFIQHIKDHLRLAFLTPVFSLYREALITAIGKVDDKFVRSDLENRLRIPGEMVELLIVFLAFQSQARSTERMLVLVFDNIDTLPYEAQKECVRAITGFRDSLKKTLLAVAPSFNEKSPQGLLKFIVALRPETYDSIFNPVSGEHWPPDKGAARVNLVDRIDINAWALAKRRLENHTLFQERNLKVVSGLLFGGGESGSKANPQLTQDDCRHYILGLIDWLHAHDKGFSDQFWEFCGSSIRRNLLFTLKMIGHPNVQEQFDEDRLAAQRTEAKSTRNFLSMSPGREIATELGRKEFRRLLVHAMFDFEQRITSSGTLEAKSFILNPFKVVKRDGIPARRNSPLLGVSLLRFLNSRVESDFVYHRTLMEAMTEIGYPEVKWIWEAIETFVGVYLLKPVAGGGPASPNGDGYIIDKLAVSRYWALMTFVDRQWSDSFFIHCMRNLFELRSYQKFDDAIERGHMIFVFVHETMKAEARFGAMVKTRRQAVRKAADGQSLRFFEIIRGDNLLSDWRGRVSHARSSEAAKKSDRLRYILAHIDKIDSAISELRKDLQY